MNSFRRGYSLYLQDRAEVGGEWRDSDAVTVTGVVRIQSGPRLDPFALPGVAPDKLYRVEGETMLVM
jgi:hypothetical protein